MDVCGCQSPLLPAPCGLPALESVGYHLTIHSASLSIALLTDHIQIEVYITAEQIATFVYYIFGQYYFLSHTRSISSLILFIFSHVIRKFGVMIRGKKERNSHNSINKSSTSKNYYQVCNK